SLLLPDSRSLLDLHSLPTRRSSDLGLGKATTTLLINLCASSVRILFIYLGIPLAGLRAYLWGMVISQIFAACAAWLCIRQNVRRSEEHTSELQSRFDLVCRLLLEKK